MYFAELNETITNCCSACFNRIARQLGNNPQTNEPLVPLVPEHNEEVVETSRWTEEEMEIAKQGMFIFRVLYASGNFWKIKREENIKCSL